MVSGVHQKNVKDYVLMINKYYYSFCNKINQLVKSSRNKKDLNDVTAALFSVSFSKLSAAKKPH